MTKQLIINYDPEIDESLWDISDASKDLIKRFDGLNKTALKAERQLLKFDEINRLVATELKEKEEKAEKTGSGGKSSSGSSKSSSSKSTTKKEDKPGATYQKIKEGIQNAKDKTIGQKRANPTTNYADTNKAEGTIYFTIKDVLFSWKDLNWEQIMMKIIAGISALGGAWIGGSVGGVPGAIIGLAAGLLFGIMLDETIFNFDGELSWDEIWKSLLNILAPIAGGVIGALSIGPLGAAIGITVGCILSFVITDTNWSDVKEKWDRFFTDLNQNFDLRWQAFKNHVTGLWSDIKNWFRDRISFEGITLKLPHIRVIWQELAEDSVIRKLFGISAIPDLTVEWYARGGIVDGPTLIGAGEAGKEAIIPLERNTGWIRRVAEELLKELEKLAPSDAFGSIVLPDAAKGALTPPAAAATSAPLDLSSLADTIAEAISSLGTNQASASDPIIRVYLDGKQLTDVVTKYQRRSERAFG